MPFLREMLYEAVYWRSIPTNDNPPFDEGLAAPGVAEALEAWGERDGDTAVIAMVDSTPAGAAWYRYYRGFNAIRGFVDEATPVVVFAVAREYRRNGVATRLCGGLNEAATGNGVQRLSLMVSNENPGLIVYRACGFRVQAESNGSTLMTRDLEP